MQPASTTYVEMRLISLTGEGNPERVQEFVRREEAEVRKLLEREDWFTMDRIADLYWKYCEENNAERE